MQEYVWCAVGYVNREDLSSLDTMGCVEWGTLKEDMYGVGVQHGACKESMYVLGILLQRGVHHSQQDIPSVYMISMMGRM